jgi:hypothetical protein
VASAPTEAVADGLLFATPQPSDVTAAGVLVYDNDGEIVYFRPNLDRGIAVGNAAVLELDGEPVLSWFEGAQHYGPGSYRGEHVLVDSAYTEVARLNMTNGYEADIHDLIITPEGTALMMAYYPFVCDASVLAGCLPGSIVIDGVVQEIDIATGTLLFEWHALDHLPISDSLVDPAENPFDFIHLNSLDVDEDGNILISARYTSALYKIDRSTGEVLFIFGGKGNQFEYVDEGSATLPGPDYPHDFRTRGNGKYSYFDNGTQRGIESRGALVSLDLNTMTATYVESITHDPPILGVSQGRIQGLSGGNELITWGGGGVVTEYAADRAVAFEAALGIGTYRQVRHIWVGEPADPPTAVLSGSEGSQAVAVSWNGDTRTDSWQLLGGEDAEQLSAVSVTPRDGFETEIAIPAPLGYVAVQALDADGRPIEGGRSAPMQVS